jgi:hypothetical protein
MLAGCPRCVRQGLAVNLTVEHDLGPLAGTATCSRCARRSQ